ncbi:hypothetical protein Droror1_Dr00004392 [Drosera rotundifolia]
MPSLFSLTQTTLTTISHGIRRHQFLDDLQQRPHVPILFASQSIRRRAAAVFVHLQSRSPLQSKSHRRSVVEGAALVNWPKSMEGGEGLRVAGMVELEADD